ncbi:MAG: SPOR domain-containing protein, partial [Magnetococcales bacterium]|nr:SPOR domain-containing protein [Magnetococcales bacterium]
KPLSGLRPEPHQGAALDNETFTIQRRLESGPSGDLFLAQDRTDDALVVLKPLPETLVRDTDAFFTRFKRAFHGCQALRHDRIAALRGHVFDRERQRHFWVRLHAPGINLEQYRLERPGGRVAWGEALAIGQKVAAILDFAHAATLSHRALKPQNVILSPTGGVCLVDFGMAYAIRDLVHRLGGELPIPFLEKSHPYTAPEQFLLEHAPGESVPRAALYVQRNGVRLVGGEPGPAADVFALGVMLYELVTGRVPFTSAQIATLATPHDNGALSGLGLLATLTEAHIRLNNGVTPGFGAPPPLNESRIRVFARALHWQPEQRFASAGDFMAAFAPVMIPRISTESPVPAREPLAKAVPDPSDQIPERAASVATQSSESAREGGVGVAPHPPESLREGGVGVAPHPPESLREGGVGVATSPPIPIRDAVVKAVPNPPHPARPDFLPRDRSATEIARNPMWDHAPRHDPFSHLVVEPDLQNDRPLRGGRTGFFRLLSRMSVLLLVVGGAVGASVLGWAVHTDDAKNRSRQQSIAEGEVMLARTPASKEVDTPGQDDPLRAVAAVTSVPEDPGKVVALLALADRDMQAMRMMATSGDQALGRYQEALRLDPGNAAARQGVSQVAEKYAQVAQTAIGHLTRMAAEGAVRGVPVRDGDGVTVAALRTELEAKTHEVEQERTRADLLEKQLQEVKGQMVRLAALEEKLQAWEADKNRLAELEKQVADNRAQQKRIQELETRLDAAHVALARVNDLERRLREVQERGAPDRAKKGVVMAALPVPAPGSPKRVVMAALPVSASGPPDAGAMPEAHEEGVFFVQLAAHRTEEKARGMEESLHQKIGGLPGMAFSRQMAEVGGATWYRVRTGPFPQREVAEQALQEIRERTGIAGMVLRQGAW